MNNYRASNSFLQRIKNLPFWVRLLIAGFIIMSGRFLIGLGSLIGLFFLIVAIGPIWFIPYACEGTVISIMLTIALVAAYYSPLFIIKRKVRYRGHAYFYNKTWIRLLIGYEIVNIVSVAVALFLALSEK